VQSKHLIAGIGVIALAATGTFGYLAWRSVTVKSAHPDEALERFTQIRDRLGTTIPMLSIDSAGTVTSRRQPAPTSEPAVPKMLHVLAYRAPQERLVRADVPFWLLKLKGPAIQYSLRETGLNLERLGVSPADLERYGACLLIDERRANGDRLLVWTE
jgi:hypothetical protein